MRWEWERRMNQLFAPICWLNFSWVWVHPGLHLMFTACLWLEDVTLFLWILLSQEEFSQQPAVTWLAWTIEWSPLCCRSGIFTGSLPLSGPRTGPPGHCSPELGREFLLHSILNSLASGDRGARTSVVCTPPQICHSGPASWAHRLDLNIYMSSLTVLSDETCKVF